MTVRVTRELLIGWGYPVDVLDRLLADPRSGVETSRVIEIPGQPRLVSASSGDGWWSLSVGLWRFAALNELLRKGPWESRRLKRRDREVICEMWRRAGFPPADGKRRVSLRITLPPKRRRHDPDAFWKSGLDSLTHAGALIDDGPDYCEPGTVTYNRGDSLETTIVLEEVSDG